MIEPVDDGLIDRYVAGECSRAEVDRVRRWIAADPDGEVRVARAQAMWNAARAPSDQWDVDQAWEQTRTAIRLASLTHQPVPAVPPHAAAGAGPHKWVGHESTGRARSRLLGRTSLLAAAACLIIGVFAVWRETSTSTRRVSLARPESITTGARQRVTVQLRDGSRVVLAPETRLVETAQFGATTREVVLDGAAYFDVVHDPSRPFVVITHDLRIRDLGTQFAVDAYAVGSTSSGAASPTPALVAVTAGSVQMEAVGRGRAPTGDTEGQAVVAPGPVVVRAGHVGRMDGSGHIAVGPAADVSQYVSWTTGSLTFDDVPLSEAVPRLERWYGVHVVLGEPGLGCRHISATFHDEPLAQVLDELSLVLHARHARSGDSVTLEPTDAGDHRSLPSVKASTAPVCAPGQVP